MGTSTSRLAYPDVEAFFNRALEDEIGARMAFQLEGHARQFLVRCNTFRAICRQDNQRIYPDRNHQLHGRSEYDPLQLSVIPAADDSDWFVYARRLVLDESAVESLSEIEGASNGS